MDKIESREKHFNNEFQNYIKQFKDISIELSNIQSTIKEIEVDKENLTKELNDVINENDVIKVQMEQKGASMSDGSKTLYLIENFFLKEKHKSFKIVFFNFSIIGPVINIKKAIAKLKEDITQMNLEIGLLTHIIDQDTLRQASLYSELENMPTDTS